MRAPVTVLTATIPGREVLLHEAIESVYGQTVEVEAHLIMAQSTTEGLPSPQHCALQQNALLASVTTEWTLRLADDDLLLSDHVERILPHLDRADVVYSWDQAGNRPRIDCTGWPRSRLLQQLAQRSWIDGSGVWVRTALLRDIGGWPTEVVGNPPMHGHFLSCGHATCEDWACFYLLAKAGARFRCVPEETWLYRAGGWPRISMED
jgi:hypothetical protein